MELEPGTSYKMVISHEFTDILGNPLTDPVDIRFKSMDLPPVLTAPKDSLFLEKGVNRLPVKVRNIANIRAKAYRFDSPKQFVKALTMGKRSSGIEYGLAGEGESLKVEQTRFEPNSLRQIDLRLENISGLLCVEISGNGTGSEANGAIAETVLVQSTDLGITSKVFENTVFSWVTRLHDASPVPGAKLSLYDGWGEKVGEAVTESSGVANHRAERIVSSSGLRETVFVVAEKEGAVAVSRLVDNYLSRPWQFGLKGEVEGTGTLYAAIFTERGVYRPGETVHLKTIAGKTPSRGNDLELVIKDPRGQQVLAETLSPDRFGCADIDIKLKEEAAVGEYLIQASVGDRRTVRKFQVQEYRVPTFRFR